MQEYSIHQTYMRRCFELAQRSAGWNAPNPKVGAVVVYNNRIIGEGYHQRCGEGHAEVNAINSVKEKDKRYLSKATIYVSLEPCFHFGKTPPCVDLILKHKIPTVVIACKDPFEKVAGRSIEKLRAAGITVLTDVLKEEGEWLARRFFTNVRLKRPYIVLKYAQSADGFIGQENKEVAISNPTCKRLVHKWRSEESSILVGTNTAACDDPQLNIRHYFGKAPLRLVIDQELRLPTDLQLFDKKQATWVFTGQPTTTESPTIAYKQCNFEQALLPQILHYLSEGKIQSLFVEGGRFLLQQFLDAGLWDELRVLESPIYLNEGIKAPDLPKRVLVDRFNVMDNKVKIYKKP